MTRSTRMTWAGSCVLSGVLGAAVTLMLGAGAAQNAQQPSAPAVKAKKIPVSIAFAPGSSDNPQSGYLICVCTDGTFMKASCNSGTIGGWSAAD